MFVLNMTTVPFKICARGKKVILTPGTYVHVDNDMITEKALKDIYGHRIKVVKEDGEIPKAAIVKEEKKTPIEKVDELTDTSLKSILEEVKAELEESEEDNSNELSEQEIQEALEDLETKTPEKEEEIVNDENSDVIIVPTTPVPVDETPKKTSGRTKSTKTRTRRTSRKKQNKEL